MQAASSDKTFSALAYSYGASKVWQDERAKFVICRATPLGKAGDPSVCESQVNAFLTCYKTVVDKSQKGCSSEFKTIVSCLKENQSDGNSTTVCANSLDEFSKWL